MLTSAFPRLVTPLIPVLLAGSLAWAGPRFEVVVPEGSAALDRFAGLELRESLATLYGEDVQIRSRPSEEAGTSFLMGAAGQAERSVPEGGFQCLADEALHSILVTGGSARARLWGAYDLISRLGVRYALDGDVLPSEPAELVLDAGRKYEPDFATRIWGLRLDSPLGPGSWSLAEHRRAVRQLAKNRFTGVILEVRPWQPFVHYSVGGRERSTGNLWRRRFPLDSQSAGKAAFGGAKEFQNPAFAGRDTYAQRRAAAQSLARGISAEARRLGMTCGLSLAPFEFPLEYRDVLHGVYRVDSASVLPGRRVLSRDAVLADGIRARLSAAIATYRDVDEILLDLRHLPPWGGPGGREADEVAALEFIRDLLADGEVLRRPQGSAVRLSIEGVSPAAPFFVKGLPAGTRFLHEPTIDVPHFHVPQTLASLDLGGRDRGALPRLATRTAEHALRTLRERRIDGYIVRAGLVGDLDLLAHFLGQASFDRRVTARSAAESFWRPFADAASLERLLRGFEQIQDAAELIDAAPIDLEATPPAMSPPWLEKVNELYGSALIEMHRSRFGIHANAQRVVMYFAKRTEFATTYLAALTANAAALTPGADADSRIEKLEEGIDSLYDAADAIREVIRSNGDRGLIAVLNEYAYRDLLGRAEALQDD